MHEGAAGEGFSVLAALDELGDVAVMVGLLDLRGGDVRLVVDVVGMPEAAVSW